MFGLYTIAGGLESGLLLMYLLLKATFKHENFETELLKVAGAQNLFEVATTLVTPFKIFMFKGGFEKEITRSNLDPNPPTIVDNPNTISRGIQGNYAQSGTPLHTKYLSSKVLRSLEDKKFDDKIQEVLFRSENEN